MRFLEPMQVIEDTRAKIVACARQWLETPYHTGGRIKSVGVDCLTLLAEVYAEAGAVKRVEIPYYPNDWHLHRSSERYLEGLLHYTKEIDAPLPGDIALWKFGRCFSHGAIVVDWPVIIHAYVGRECTLEDASKAKWLMYVGENTAGQGKMRPVRFFSVFEIREL